MKDSAIYVSFADGCAWRAVYVRWTAVERQGCYVVPTGRERRLLTLGIDPNDGTKPQVFGNVLGLDFRFRLPVLRWSMRVVSCRPLYWFYRKQSAFWHRVDGRYRFYHPELGQ